MKCTYCGLIHDFACPKVKSIDYHLDGTVKHVEFVTPAAFRPMTAGEEFAEWVRESW